VRTALWIALAIGSVACAPRADAPPFATVGGRVIPEDPIREPLDDPGPLSLERATVLTLERNPDLAVQRLAPAVAERFEELERAEFGATLFGDARYRRERSNVTNRATMERFDVEGSDVNATLGVRQRTPTGTQVEASLGYALDESNRAPTQQGLRGSLTLTQSLLRGISPESSLARVRQAELDTRASRYQLRAFVTALLLELETAYWELALAERRTRIHEESLAVAEREVSEVEARIEIGDLAPADAPVIQATVARRRSALLDAEADVRGARLRLRRMLGASPEAEVEASDEIAIEPVPVEDAAAHRELALRMRPEIGEARLRLEQRRLDVVVTGHGLLPRLDVFVQLAKTGFGSTFGDAVRGLGEPTYELSVGLDFERLLGNGAAEAADAQSRLREEQAARSVENLGTTVVLDVDLALNELSRTRAQIEATREVAARQAEVVASERGRLEVGEGTALLVAQAERDLVEAQVAEVSALVAYRVALLRLYAAEGTLLERRAVTLGE